MAQRIGLPVLAVLLALAGLAAWEGARPGRGLLPFGPPDRPGFSFPPPKVSVSSLSGKRAHAPRRAVATVSGTMSALYDRLFVDPDAWGEEPDPEAWAAFSPGAMARARQEARSFTLGRIGPRVESLDVTVSRLGIRLLLSPTNHPIAAFARVRFEAAGGLEEAKQFVLENWATYILRPTGDRWLIVAYPSARTRVRVRPARTGPVPTATE